MKIRLGAAVLAIIAAATTHAQLTQAVAAAITQDAASDYFLEAVLLPSSTTSGTKILDIRSEYGNGYWVISGPPWQETARHNYAGYVRVKWIGEDPPKLDTSYEATYDVWAIRAGAAHVNLGKPNPPRSVTIHASFMNTYIPNISLDVSASSPGTDIDGGGDVALGAVFTEALPTAQNDPPWSYRGNYVSSASFSWDTDGYYADCEVVGVTSFNEADLWTGTGFSVQDSWGAQYETRAVYKLVSVAGEPVG